MLNKSNGWPEHCAACGGNGLTACEHGSFANCPGADELRNCGVNVEAYRQSVNDRLDREFREECRERELRRLAQSIVDRTPELLAICDRHINRPWWKFW